jgi:hypothetical protein
LASVTVALAARLRALPATVALRLAVVFWVLARRAVAGWERVLAGLRAVLAGLRAEVVFLAAVAGLAGAALGVESPVDAICGTPRIED